MLEPVLIETVRTVPISVRNDYPPGDVDVEVCDKGFPFDDDNDFERDRSFDSHLSNLVERHPELAEHFDRFPFRSNSWGQKRRGSASSGDESNRPGSSEQHKSRPTRAPFGSSRFEQFGFPFSSRFEDEPECPQPQPTQSHTETKEERPEPPPQVEKPPQVPPSERGRKQQNIQQSNTVDLGQKQDPVDDTRGQRSMSAPPENRAGQPRYVSSINIPINVDASAEMGGRQSQQQQPQQPQSGKPAERVIPIHVEGRDEPVLPKNAHTTFSQPPPQPQQQQQPHVDRSFNARPTPWTTRTEPEDPSKQQPQQKQPEPPQPQTRYGPIEQIQSIQKEVLDLMTQVEKFNGKPRDKQYAYLDEMLTRNLLKLDNVETEGKENIRLARKEAIKCIQKCISILETKAQANEQIGKLEVEAKSEDAPKEPQTQEPEQEDAPETQPASMDIEEAAAKASQESPDKPEDAQEPAPADSGDSKPLTTDTMEVETPSTPADTDKKEKKKVKKKADKKPSQ